LPRNVVANEMTRSVLITGGAGFIGANLAVRLKEWHPEWHITALDNLRRRGSELNLPRLGAAGVTFVHGDVRAADDLPSDPVDAIIECAAEPSVLAGHGGESPRYVIEANLGGLIHCLELARARGADLIFLSTSRVYPVAALNSLRVCEEPTRFVLEAEQPLPGASACGVAETFPLEGARSLYGASKLCGELLISEYAAAYGLRAVINRCGVIAGPWQMGKVDQGVFALWMAAHVFNRPLAYLGWGGTGKQVRDLLHVEDLCELVDRQLTETERFAGQTLNVGGGTANSLSLQETTRLCQQITGRQIAVGSCPENRPADVRLYQSDCRRLEQLCGWRPTRTPEQVLADLHAWMVAHYDLLRPVFGG
jgi:CDP-paratose 2-epimerase